MTRTPRLAALAAAIAIAAAVSSAGPADAAHRFRPCTYEDGSGQTRCVWDARHSGNGHGQSLKIIHGGEDDARYVEITHRRAHRLLHR